MFERTKLVRSTDCSWDYAIVTAINHADRKVQKCRLTLNRENTTSRCTQRCTTTTVTERPRAERSVNCFRFDVRFACVRQRTISRAPALCPFSCVPRRKLRSAATIGETAVSTDERLRNSQLRSTRPRTKRTNFANRRADGSFGLFFGRNVGRFDVAEDERDAHAVERERDALWLIIDQRLLSEIQIGTVAQLAPIYRDIGQLCFHIAEAITAQ